jgi:hypothetical protein
VARSVSWRHWRTQAADSQPPHPLTSSSSSSQRRGQGAEGSQQSDPHKGAGVGVPVCSSTVGQRVDSTHQEEVGGASGAPCA